MSFCLFCHFFQIKTAVFLLIRESRSTQATGRQQYIFSFSAPWSYKYVIKFRRNMRTSLVPWKLSEAPLWKLSSSMGTPFVPVVWGFYSCPFNHASLPATTTTALQFKITSNAGGSEIPSHWILQEPIPERVLALVPFARPSCLVSR